MNISKTVKDKSLKFWSGKKLDLSKWVPIVLRCALTPQRVIFLGPKIPGFTLCSSCSSVLVLFMSESKACFSCLVAMGNSDPLSLTHPHLK